MRSIPKYYDSLEELCNLIDRGIPFREASWGDGEVSCMLGQEGQTVDGARYSEALSKDLWLALERVDWARLYVGKWSALQSQFYQALRARGINVPRKVTKLSLEDPDYGSAKTPVRWAPKGLLEHCNLNGRLRPFIRSLRRQEVIVVGPDYLSAFAEQVLDAHLVDVHESEAYRDIEETVDRVLDQAQEPWRSVVLWSAGPAANVGISMCDGIMQRDGPDPAVSMLDCGSIWDPYCGRKNRSAFRRPGVEKTMRKNLPEGVQWSFGR